MFSHTALKCVAGRTARASKTVSLSTTRGKRITFGGSGSGSDCRTRASRLAEQFGRERVERLRAGESDPAWERAKPLGVDLPTLEVDTTDGYAPALDAGPDVCARFAKFPSGHRQLNARTIGAQARKPPRPGIRPDGPLRR
jgi:hypothetical protein